MGIQEPLADLLDLALILISTSSNPWQLIVNNDQMAAETKLEF